MSMSGRDADQSVPESPMEDVRSAAEDNTGDASALRKRKAAKASSRGVANLTPEQLAKKRANDREAQRNIRERTKRQIETLERRIEELTNQKPYQDLQAVVREKEAVERENVEIKKKLASVIETLRCVIGNDAFIDTSHHVPRHTAMIGASASSSALPGLPQTQTQTHPVSQPWSSQRSTPGYTPSPTTASRLHSDADQQQPGDHRLSLDMGQERLDLDFLLNARKAPKPANEHYTQQPPSISAQHAHAMQSYQSLPSGYPYGDPNISTLPASDDPGELIELSDTNMGTIARYAAPVRTSAPTCPLDSLLLDFLHERKQRAAEGHSVHDVIGPRYPSVSSLLNPMQSVHSHPLSRVFTDILAKFPDISGLPERVAVLYIMFLVMRWQVSPTRENYERLPPWMHPLRCQILTPHPAWIDHLPFPGMRDKLVRLYNPTDYHFENFFIPYTTTLELSWPYDDTDTLLRSPDSGELVINPVFERHLRNLNNWKLGDAFARAFPVLAEDANIPRSPAAYTQSSHSPATHR